MATDATGTPSANRSYPKYNTSADAPSGVGLNNIVDAIDTDVQSIADDVATAIAPDGVPGDGDILVYDSGTGTWVPQAQTSQATAVGTSLPGSPVDGDEYILTDSLTAPTYAWRFIYSTGVSDSNKWVFLGGSALSAEVAASQSTSSPSYVDLTTAGPSVTVPRAGVYTVRFGAAASNATGGTNTAVFAVKIGAAATSDSDGAVVGWGSGTAGSVQVNAQRTMLKTLAASDVLKIQYRATASISASFNARWIAVTPVRVA